MATNLFDLDYLVKHFDTKVPLNGQFYLFKPGSGSVSSERSGYEPDTVADMLERIRGARAQRRLIDKSIVDMTAEIEYAIGPQPEDEDPLS